MNINIYIKVKHSVLRSTNPPNNEKEKPRNRIEKKITPPESLELNFRN